MKYLKKFESENLYAELMDIINLASDVDPSNYDVEIFPDVEFFEESGKCHLELRRKMHNDSQEFYDLISSIYDRLQYSRFDHSAKIEYFHGSPDKPEPGPSGGIFPMVETISSSEELKRFLENEQVYVGSIDIKIYEPDIRDKWVDSLRVPESVGYMEPIVHSVCDMIEDEGFIVQKRQNYRNCPQLNIARENTHNTGDVFGDREHFVEVCQSTIERLLTEYTDVDVQLYYYMKDNKSNNASKGIMMMTPEYNVEDFTELLKLKSQYKYLKDKPSPISLFFDKKFKLYVNTDKEQPDTEEDGDWLYYEPAEIKVVLTNSKRLSQNIMKFEQWKK